MELVWTRTVDAVRDTANALGPALAAGWSALGPWRWPLLAVAALVVVIAALRGVRRWIRARRGRAPELLLTRGGLRLLERENGEGERFALGGAIANLGDEPVQLLEIAVRTEFADTPALLERGDVVAPRGSTELAGTLGGLAGDHGVIDVYFRTRRTRAGARSRVWRLRAELAWEPWRGRYRVQPLEQRVDRVRELPSSRRSDEDRAAWQRRREALRSSSVAPARRVAEVPPEGIPAPRPAPRREPERGADRGFRRGSRRGSRGGTEPVGEVDVVVTAVSGGVGVATAAPIEAAPRGSRARSANDGEPDGGEPDDGGGEADRGAGAEEGAAAERTPTRPANGRTRGSSGERSAAASNAEPDEPGPATGEEVGEEAAEEAGDDGGAEEAARDANAQGGGGTTEEESAKDDGAKTDGAQEGADPPEARRRRRSRLEFPDDF